MTIEGNVFGECHAPSTLKTSFVVLKRVGVYIAATKLNCSSLHNSSYCSSLHNSSYFFIGSQKLLTRFTHPFPRFYIVFYILLILVLNIAEILSAGLYSINQS